MKRKALYCKAIALKDLPDFIRKLGGSPEKLFSRYEMDMSHALSGNNFYDWNKACRLLEHAALELDEPYLGLKWAHSLPRDFMNSGPMVLLGALMPTVRDFFDFGNTYQKIHINGVAYHYTERAAEGDVECEVRVHPYSAPCHQFIEHIMATVFLMEQHYIGEARFKKVTFQHRAPEDLSWHEKIFKCPIEFNARKNAAYAEPSFLDIKLSGRLEKLRPVVKLYMDRRANRNTRFETSIAQTVELMLPNVFGMRKSGLNDVAHILDISPKKLQRLLGEEEVKYSDILDNVRKAMAQRLLFESDISISHLAVLLDYSSSEAFNAACKRWVGMSPRQYRKKLRSQT